MRQFAATLILSLSAAMVGAAETNADDAIEEVIVYGTSVTDARASIGSVTTIDGDSIEVTRANHVNEVMVRIPGVWISRGSGQEHLTAIRSAVLTGAGACGGFLYLENGVPIRPTGFCNVNNLFEVNTEQADAIEVIRGPASAAFGGNALHGVVNTISTESRPGMRAGVEFGSESHGRARVAYATDSFAMRINTATTDGYRDNTGFDQHKANLRWATATNSWRAVHSLTFTELMQETGGFVRGFEAYKDSALRSSNPNPEAYRNAWAARLTSHWTRDFDDVQLNVVPYARRSTMAFLQHFLPGQPLERNAQTSFGAIARLSGSNGRVDWRIGVHGETMAGMLSEVQDSPTTGSLFLRTTRPAGTHYDYDIDSNMIAAFYDVEIDLGNEVALVHSLRAESVKYDYTNHHLVGNTKDDGTACGFGGCLYTRPANRTDTFTDVGGRIGATWRPTDNVEWYGVYGLGFRPPQATELYRLQSGQTTADISSEEIRSIEFGSRFAGGPWVGSVALFDEVVTDQIFRDADGFNVSDGETSARGIEFELAYQMNDTHRFDVVGSHTNHEYEFDRRAALGEVITSGNEVDTAPEWLASARWHARLGRFMSEFEWVLVGEHFVNAANTASYEGHRVFHWRTRWQVSDRAVIFGRINNLLDEEFADRADFAFGSYRYFPSLPRQYFVGLEYELD